MLVREQNKQFFISSFPPLATSIWVLVGIAALLIPTAMLRYFRKYSIKGKGYLTTASKPKTHAKTGQWSRLEDLYVRQTDNF